MLNDDLIIVKLGGSVITDKKSETPKLRTAVLRRLAKEIAASGKRTIIVHGAGSFGHPLAKKYKLNDGLIEESQKKGFALTQASVRRLNLKVIDVLQNAGISAISLPPGAILKCRGGKVAEFGAGAFDGYLRAGLVPVTFGDAVIDESKGFCICSGDLLVEKLACEFEPEKVIFAADVDGIFDRNPAERYAKLLREISVGKIGKIAGEKSRHTDVTGGMKGKIESIKRIVAKGTQAVVLNGNKKGRLLSALLGKETVCTKVEP
ncbi:MAG: isopentenyl phosphate kinase [Candidatus Thermoplasmatota archaeon]|nr:isopentenyl phosphate kinase [Candidatus Thermoplasmatota archaeon]